MNPAVIPAFGWARLLEQQADPLAPPPELLCRLALLGTVSSLTSTPTAAP